MSSKQCKWRQVWTLVVDSGLLGLTSIKVVYYILYVTCMVSCLYSWLVHVFQSNVFNGFLAFQNKTLALDVHWRDGALLISWPLEKLPFVIWTDYWIHVTWCNPISLSEPISGSYLSIFYILHLHDLYIVLISIHFLVFISVKSDVF